MRRKEFLVIAKATFHEFNRVDVGYSAAALTYYVFFSLFPLLLLGLITLSTAIDPQAAQRFIFGQVSQLVPGAVEMLEDILGAVLEARDSAGWIAIVGIVTLAFSATGAFDALDKAINRAWGTEKMPNILVAKLTSFAMMAVIGALFVGSLVISTVLQSLQNAADPYLRAIPGDTIIWQVVNFASSLAITTLGFLLLFRFVPRCDVNRGDVWPAAILTAVVWTIAKEIFALFLGTSFANFSAVYGTLGTVIALLLWIYVSSVIILTGAEFSAETARVRRLAAKAGEARARRKPSPWLSSQ